jgi:hypothetical protein
MEASAMEASAMGASAMGAAAREHFSIELDRSPLHSKSASVSGSALRCRAISPQKSAGPPRILKFVPGWTK